MKNIVCVTGLVLFVAASVRSDEAKRQLPADHVQRMKLGTALFTKTVRPILKERCLACHGGESLEGEFSIATREELLKGGESGVAVVIYKPSESRLMRLITHEEQPHMPYDEDKLPQNQISAIEKWIELGAPFDSPLVDGPVKLTDWTNRIVPESARDYWAFQKLREVTIPEIDDDWCRTPIDRFILNKLREHNLRPNQQATRNQLIRRASFGLTGLPPDSEDLQRALNDPSADWYDNLVSRLLESPQFGEHWARKWLDVARFAESHGFEQDYDRKFAYHYRDFVIRAFNADMPYDQFTQWQLAGDELAPDNPLALMATGFLGAGVFPTQLTEKEFEPARYDELDDMVATMGTSMLGLTIGCARCHDHKFDPIPAADYYRLISTFGTTIRSHLDVDLDPQKTQRILANWEDEKTSLTAALKEYEAQELPGRFTQWLKDGRPIETEESLWTILRVTSAKSSGGATMSILPDDSILATGTNPDFDTYTFTAETNLSEIRSLRLEALSHDSMVRNGPGRASNGNMGLGKISITAAPASDPKKTTAISLVNPRATFQQNANNLSIAATIDDNAKTGWAVDPQFGKDHAAAFDFEKPLTGFDGGTRLTVTLKFDVNNKHNIGRSRLSISGQANIESLDSHGQPQAISELNEFVKNGADAGNPTVREKMLVLYQQIDSGWKLRQAAIIEHDAQKPKPQTTTIQVSSEGLKPLKHHADGRGFPHFYKETFYLKRGDANQKVRPVESGFLQVLTTGDSEKWRGKPIADSRTSLKRQSLAKWITDVDDGAGHLLARVIVNRIWHHHFGRGIVATPNDFGKQGEDPSHPELLDWLAQRLIDENWHLKPIHALIMSSAVYQQDSAHNDSGTSHNENNSLLWRYQPRRLPAESIRDAMLAVSGQLDKTQFGPGTLSQGQKRRSIYFTVKRSRLIPMMQIFDAPEPLVSVGRRPTTTIASQALTFMNSPHVRSYAAGLADRCEAPAIEESIGNVYRTALSRAADADELEVAGEFIATQVSSYIDDGQSESEARRLAMTDFCQTVLSLNEFVFVE